MSGKIPCWKCRYLQRPPQHPNYKDKVGWCMAPVPVWVTAYFNVAQPLLERKEMRGQECAAFQPKKERKP